ncbi:MAG: hypothetical protein AB1847_21335 [bacterium]
MSKLEKEIEQSMLGLWEISEEGGKAGFLFPPEFIGFKGHFPDRPILPGVCKIQAILLILKAWKKKKVTLKEIVMAKFFSPVSCGQEVIFSWREGKKKGEEPLPPEGKTPPADRQVPVTEQHGLPAEDSLIKVFITSEERKIAELHIKVHFSHEDETSCAVK